MTFENLDIDGLFLIKPDINEDDRGYFFESFRQDLLNQHLGYEINFIQDNESKSSQGILRGLHFQIPPFSQSKLVRVIKGNVLDVAVDIRKSSKTYGQHRAVKLSGDNKHQLFIPKGFAHGFIVLSDIAYFSYKVDSLYSPENERGILYNDDDLKIDWLVDPKNISISQKDSKLPNFKDCEKEFLK